MFQVKNLSGAHVRQSHTRPSKCTRTRTHVHVKRNERTNAPIAAALRARQDVYADVPAHLQRQKEALNRHLELYPPNAKH